MALTNSEYLLQQILNSADKTNENLVALKEVLTDNAKNQGRRDRTSGNNGSNNRNGANGGNGRNNTEGAMSKAFKNLFGEAKSVGSTLGGNNATASNVLGSITTSSKVLTGAFKSIPGPVGAAATAFEMVVDAGMAVYNYMEQQLKMYQELNSSGVMLADGMRTVQRGAGSSLMSINEFSAAITKNSESLAAMDGQYGNGVEHFGNLLNSVQKLEDINSTFGVSQQQLADLTAKNYKFDKLYSGNAQMRQLSETQSTANFVNSMTYLSKTVGKSVDQLLSKFDDMGSNLDSKLSVQSLQDRFNLSAETAGEVEKGMNATFASMGEVGATLQKMNASYLKYGNLPDDFDGQFTQLLAQRMQEMQAAGISDTEQLQKGVTKFIEQNKDLLDIEIKNQASAGNTIQADWLSQLQNLQQMQNKNARQPGAVWEQMTKTFDNWISNTFTGPFKKMYADTQDSVGKYLLDVANSTDGALGFISKISSDAMGKLSEGIKWLWGQMMVIPKTIGELLFGNFGDVEAAFGKLMDDVVQIPVLLGKTIWNWIGGDSFDKGSEELKGKIGSLFGHVGDIFSSFTNLTFDTADIKKRISNMYDSIKNKLTGWWDSAKGWFKGDNDKKEPIKSPLEDKANSGGVNNTSTPKTTDDMKKAPTVQQPPYTPPTKVDGAESDDSKPAPDNPVTTTQDINAAILKTIQQLLSTTESSVQADNETLNYLRQIADNTAEQRNL